MAKKEGKEHPRVFISYSHKDKEWVRNWLVPKLEAERIQTHIDYRDFEIGVASLINMERAVEQCAKTILIFTPPWVESEWTQFEGIMLQTMDPIGVRKKILPLMLEHCVLPPRLKIFTYADFRDKSNWDFEIEKLTKQIKKDFAQITKPAVKFPTLAEENVDIARLPKTGYELFGRQEELKLLDEAWESGKTNMLGFVAYGGTGKSTLINKWIERMRWDNYRGARRVYGWSFYSQGTGERVTSADTFINEALKWFGDPNPKEGSEWEKGKRLAKLVREEKTLLILDGMEPLQSYADFEKGKIKDNALAMLVTELAKENSGLCVITTRERIEDIEGQIGHLVKLVELENLSPEAGMQVLRKAGVKGTDKELKKASEEFGGHALALALLGNYLAVVHNGEIRKRDLVPALMDEEEQGGHAKRVMKSYEIWLKGTAELDILYLMGLFDRPAEKGTIVVLRAKPIIKGLTDNLAGLSEAKWKYAVEHLRELRLLAKEEKDRPDDLDCHPLVREHFGEKLKKERIEAWKEGHGRLYEYYKGETKKEQPDMLEEMEPLFRAVYHGCAAGQHQKALYDVYYPRIQRDGATNYCCTMLGAFGSDLGAVACFFEKVWDKPAAGLNEGAKAAILSWAGFRLRAVGRLREAAEPMEAGLKQIYGQKNWKNAAIGASNLSELYLSLGGVKKAVEYGRRSVEYADKSGDEFQRSSKRTTLADALHQAGDFEQARRLLEEAEGMQRKWQPEYQYLYSLRGYQYCDLLLTKGKAEEVKERARQTLEWSTEEGVLLDIALDKLSLGRAGLEELRIKKLEGRNKEKCLSEAKCWLDEAVDGLRKAGQQQELPRGLIARAGLLEFRIKNSEGRERKECLAEAWRDLEEAKEIAERGEMKLWLADYHLEGSRVCLDEGRKDDAKGHYEEAKQLI
jgi:tetratricopeptide (TPR) repeat protein